MVRLIKSGLIHKLLSMIVTVLFFTVAIADSTFAAKKDWEFVINTTDGTWKTGSTENTVGFNDYGLFEEKPQGLWESLKALLTASQENYIDQIAKKYKSESDFWKVSSGGTGDVYITENGSLCLGNAWPDLYFYGGVAFNSNGAAYQQGNFFTISWNRVETPVISGGVGDLNPLSYVDDFSLPDDNNIRGVAADFYGILMVFSVAGIVFSLIAAGIKIAIAGNKAIREGTLEEIGTKLLVFMAICAFVGLFGLIGPLIKALVDI